MDKFSFLVKLRNYFSNRIEEIQDGSYVPTYEHIKELPEYSGIKRDTFKIARKRWYSQHFGMNFRMFNEYTKRLGTVKARNISNNEYDKKHKKKIGFCISFIGALFIIYALVMGATMGWNPNYAGGWFGLSIIVCGVPGIILLSIGIFLILHNRSKASKI